jgi:CheY-like chemotaxis protein
VEESSGVTILLRRAGHELRLRGPLANDPTAHILNTLLDALEMFRKGRLRFIWMDVRLQVMNGPEATPPIRALERGRAVRIVALTTSALTEQRIQLLAAGLDDFVRKPCAAREIVEVMARRLGVRYLDQDHSVAPG